MAGNFRVSFTHNDYTSTGNIENPEVPLSTFRYLGTKKTHTTHMHTHTPMPPPPPQIVLFMAQGWFCSVFVFGLVCVLVCFDCRRAVFCLVCVFFCSVFCYLGFACVCGSSFIVCCCLFVVLLYCFFCIGLFFWLKHWLCEHACKHVCTSGVPTERPTVFACGVSQGGRLVYPV